MVIKLAGNIFDNLNTKTIKTVSATDIADLTNPIHISQADVEALERTILVNKSTYRLDGGPIPASQKIVEFTCDDSGATNAMEIADESASSGQQNPLDPFNAPGFLIDENMSILATVSVTDSTASAVRLSCTRIR